MRGSVILPRREANKWKERARFGISWHFDYTEMMLHTFSVCCYWIAWDLTCVVFVKICNSYKLQGKYLICNIYLYWFYCHNCCYYYSTTSNILFIVFIVTFFWLLIRGNLLFRTNSRTRFKWNRINGFLLLKPHLVSVLIILKDLNNNFRYSPFRCNTS